MANSPTLPPNKVAFVLDGKVLDVFHTDDRLAAILLSEPQIVDVTSLYDTKTENFHIVGWSYDGKEFIPPVTETRKIPS